MPNKIAEFYQRMRSGDDKFTMSTGRFFSIVFSFPNNQYEFLNGPGKLGNVAGGFLGALDTFGVGTAGSLLQTGAALISKEIGLNENLIPRFPQDEIHWLVKGINLPNMKTADGNSVSLTSDGGSFCTWNCPGMGTVEPEGDTFSLDMLSTVESPIEGFFQPWMEEVMSMRTGGNVPFRRANVFIHVYNENMNASSLEKLGDIIDEANVKYTYKLSGAYPVFCDTPNLSHEGLMDNRSVGFKFNKIEVFGNPLISGALSILQDKFGVGAVSPVRQAVDKVRRFI